MTRIIYTTGYGQQREVEVVTSFKRDGKTFYVIPQARGTYDVSPPFAVIEKTCEVSVVRKPKQA